MLKTQVTTRNDYQSQNHPKVKHGMMSTSSSLRTGTSLYKTTTGSLKTVTPTACFSSSEFLPHESSQCPSRSQLSLSTHANPFPSNSTSQKEVSARAQLCPPGANGVQNGKRTSEKKDAKSSSNYIHVVLYAVWTTPSASKMYTRGPFGLPRYWWPRLRAFIPKLLNGA